MPKNKNKNKNKNKSKNKNNSQKINNTNNSAINNNKNNKENLNKNIPNNKPDKTNNNPDTSQKTKNYTSLTTYIDDSSNKKSLNKIVATTAIIAILGGGFVAICHNTKQKADYSLPGIHLNGVEIAPSVESDFIATVTKILNDRLASTNINIVLPSETLTTTLSEIGAYYDIEKIASDIYSYGKSGNTITDSLVRISTFVFGKDFTPDIKIDEKILNKFIEDLSNEVNIDVTEPTITFNSNSISIDNGTAGISINAELLQKDILDLLHGDLDNTTINVEVKKTEPILTKNLASKITVLGTHKTKLPTLYSDRTSNIKLFMKKINASVIMPGEEFSSDKAGGSRTAADGYKPAGAFVNGKVVDVLAGGICQGTTTLYNALLYADLEISERHPHSQTVSYSKNGLDAAISKDIKDLKFINNTEYPVILQTYVSSDGYVVATVWGVKHEENKEIKLRTVNISPKHAIAYKETYINGELVKTEKLSEDRYK